MRISVISASQRENSESERISRFLISRVRDRSVEAELLSLKGSPLPFWDGTSEVPAWNQIAPKLRSAEGFIFVVPEWGGMVPPALKNLFLYAGTDRLTFAHKPALIVSLSAGPGGTNPVAELRAHSYKNTRICYLPEHITIRGCEQYFQSDDSSEQREINLRERIEYALDLLISYAKALVSVRKSGLNFDRYPFGM